MIFLDALYKSKTTTSKSVSLLKHNTCYDYADPRIL